MVLFCKMSFFNGIPPWKYENVMLEYPNNFLDRLSDPNPPVHTLWKSCPLKCCWKWFNNVLFLSFNRVSGCVSQFLIPTWILFQKQLSVCQYYVRCWFYSLFFRNWRNVKWFFCGVINFTYRLCWYPWYFIAADYDKICW